MPRKKVILRQKITGQRRRSSKVTETDSSSQQIHPSCDQLSNVTDEKSWVIKVNEDVRKLAQITKTEKKAWKLPSIYKLPEWVTDLNKNAYKPQMISFGPVHHKDRNLQHMERHKDRALLHFLKRSEKPIDFYVEEIKKRVQDLKDAYDYQHLKHSFMIDYLDLEDEEDLEEFVELMIRDGSFMIEILRRSSSDADGRATNRYVENDPIFSSHGDLYVMPFIWRDMLILENQLPMLLLTTLLWAQDETKAEEEIDKLMQQFCPPGSKVKNLGKCKHVLEVYRKGLLGEDPCTPKSETQPPKGTSMDGEDPCSPKSETQPPKGISMDREDPCTPKLETQPPKGTSMDGDNIIPSATELQEAGIRIVKNKTGSLKDISFNSGVLTLPSIVVDDTTESVYLNLMAFERFHIGAGNEVTSYISFMDDIIDNAKDVSLLCTREIIHNMIGSNKAVAKLFNSLSKDITMDSESNLIAVRKMVNQYRKRSWNQLRGNLIHTYFRNPWAILSVIAAIFLFALTIVQTAYTIGQYYQNS